MIIEPTTHPPGAAPAAPGFFLFTFNKNVMTLGFSTRFPWNEPTRFVEKILKPYNPHQSTIHIPKIHTFRLGNRWRAGMAMHMVTGNRTKNRQQFNTNIPELQKCVSVQSCIIRTVNFPAQGISIEVDGREVDPILFAVHDGFDSLDQCFRWFSDPSKPARHEGQIVHFTEFRYK